MLRRINRMGQDLIDAAAKPHVAAKKEFRALTLKFGFNDLGHRLVFVKPMNRFEKKGRD